MAEKEKIKKARIDASVQNKRGGQPHDMRDIGMVKASMGDVTIKCEAVVTEHGERKRLDVPQVTIRKSEQEVCKIDAPMLADIVQEYFGVKL